MSSSQLPIVYADESNNSGENLQDSDQPVFTVAGVHLDDGSAQVLIDQIKAVLQAGAGEPKYSLLRKRGRSRAALLEVLEELPPDHVKTFVADKKFMIVSKIIDLGPEPILMDAGYNMHADGAAHGLANLVATTGPVLGDAVAFDKVLETFVSAVRELPGSTPTLYVKAARAYLATLDPTARNTFRTALLPDPAWLHQLMFRRALGEHADELDPAIPCVAVMCGGFQSLFESFKLVHDHSKVIDRAKWTLLNIEKLPDVADPTKLQASIGVREIDFANSKDHPQLQIADWVAGFSKDVATVQWYGKDAVYPPKAIALAESWLASGPLAVDQDLIANLGS